MSCIFLSMSFFFHKIVLVWKTPKKGPEKYIVCSAKNPVLRFGFVNVTMVPETQQKGKNSPFKCCPNFRSQNFTILLNRNINKKSVLKSESVNPPQHIWNCFQGLEIFHTSFPFYRSAYRMWSVRMGSHVTFENLCILTKSHVLGLTLTFKVFFVWMMLSY